METLKWIGLQKGYAAKDFPDFESALVRAGLALRRQKHFGRDAG
ncbi:hypothetical protein [Methylococcus sp. EFPC2]|nr:hypothetical protein [Methylococcus sp. EFPC2]